MVKICSQIVTFSLICKTVCRKEMERSNAYYATMQRKVGMSWKENNVVVLRKNKSQYYLKKTSPEFEGFEFNIGKALWKWASEFW